MEGRSRKRDSKYFSSLYNLPFYLAVNRDENTNFYKVVEEARMEDKDFRQRRFRWTREFISFPFCRPLVKLKNLEIKTRQYLRTQSNLFSFKFTFRESRKIWIF